MEQQDRQDPALLGAAQSHSAPVHSRLDRTEDRELHLVSEPLFRPNSESFPTSSVHPPGSNGKEGPYEDAFDRAAPRLSLHDPPRNSAGGAWPRTAGTSATSTTARSALAHDRRAT